MTAIYQQARPITFGGVVGQEHVKSVLVAALSKGRIGHAYLFSGPRGVGKTTMARLLAMAVNCERPDPKERPCGECESCLLVRRGNHPDVTELDAASNNSVEDIRDLREKVRLASIRGGRRVWVLDEAHMLSKSASNALLKTLEEPPPGLVFILATTEPEKLPPTILSRCQHFRFRRLSEDEIAGKVARLCEAAGVPAEDEAVRLVARAADGAMRDAESLLERLLTSGEPITRGDAEDALGLPPKERMQALAEHLVNGDLAALFELAGSLYRDGFAPRSLSEHLKTTLRDALYSMVGVGDGFTLPIEQKDLLRAIHALDDEDERFVRRDDLFSLEVALIKAMNATNHNVPREAVAPLEERQARAPQRTTEPQSSLPDFDPTGRGTTPPPPARTPARAPASPPNPPSTPPPAATTPGGDEPPKINWHTVLTKASAQLKAFMMPAQAEVDGYDIYLRFPETHKFHFEQLKKRQDELGALTAQVVGDGAVVHIVGPGETVRKKL